MTVAPPARIWQRPDATLTPTLLADWATDAADPLRVYVEGDRVEIRGTVTKPTNATAAQRDVAQLPASIDPGRSINTGLETRVFQNAQRANCYFQVINNRVRIQGQRTNQPVNEAHVYITYHLGGF